MKILVISNFYPPHHGGGYGLLCYRIATGLLGLGHEVRVLTSAPSDERGAVQEVDEPGIAVSRRLEVISPGDRLKLLVKTLGNRRAIRRAISDDRPDVVYCFGFDGIGFDAYDAATNSGVPSLTYLGDTWLGQAWRDLARFDPWSSLAAGRCGPRPIRPILRALGRAGRAVGVHAGDRPRGMGPIQAISRFVLEDLRSAGAPAGPGSGVVLPPLPHPYLSASGEPIGRSGARCATLRALFVSRMERLKGPDTAIEAVAIASRQGADVTLRLAGIARERMTRELSEMAGRLGVADRVEFAGSPGPAGLVDLYRGSDVFVFPSRIVEGFGMVNAEAMACGLPVLGTSHSGSAEIIRDGVTGFRFPADDARALGGLLARLHSDRPMLERLSGGAIDASRRHNAARILRQIEGDLRAAAGAIGAPNFSGQCVLS